jgi:hypothetical protein
MQHKNLRETKKKKKSTIATRKHITQQENDHATKWIQIPITKTTKRMTKRMMLLFHNTKRKGHSIMKATHQKTKK